MFRSDKYEGNYLIERYDRHRSGIALTPCRPIDADGPYSMCWRRGCPVPHCPISHYWRLLLLCI